MQQRVESVFSVENARDDDFDELYAFLFGQPHPHLYRRSPGDVRAMLAAGLFFVVRQRPNWRIVAACYLADPSDSADGPWELGGFLSDAEIEGTGIFSILAMAAVVNLFVMMAPVGSLISHVVRGNDAPRSILDRLGFEITESDRAYLLAELPGLHHMQPDAQGYVYADTYTFNPAKACTLFRRAAAFDGSVTREGVTRTVRIELESFDPASLEELCLNCP